MCELIRRNLEHIVQDSINQSKSLSIVKEFTEQYMVQILFRNFEPTRHNVLQMMREAYGDSRHPRPRELSPITLIVSENVRKEGKYRLSCKFGGPQDVSEKSSLRDPEVSI